jgi:hypothetical protein
VIYGAGPRTVLESNAKRADEHLVLADLRRATKVVARSLADLPADNRTTEALVQAPLRMELEPSPRGLTGDRHFPTRSPIAALARRHVLAALTAAARPAGLATCGAGAGHAHQVPARLALRRPGRAVPGRGQGLLQGRGWT